jgi:hypothetical protein
VGQLQLGHHLCQWRQSQRERHRTIVQPAAAHAAIAVQPLIFGANGSLTRSDANVARYDTDAKRMRSRSIKLPGQSDQVLNLMLGYEQGPLSARVAVNYKSEYLLEMGDDILDAKQDRIVDAQKQVDFSASYQLSKQVQLNLKQPT